MRWTYYETHLPERAGLAPRLHGLALRRGPVSPAFWSARKCLTFAIVVPAVLPGGAGAAFATKAWAVERHADGTVTLTLDQEFSDLNGLQATLRADGVPAIIIWRRTNSAGKRATRPRASRPAGYYMTQAPSALLHRLCMA